MTIINGPNLNLLGSREPGIYGTTAFEECLEALRREFPGVDIDYFQSNSEGAIIDKIHALYASARERGVVENLVINPGAYSHYSIAIADAIAAVADNVRTIEVHISNIHAREPYRRQSVTAEKALGVIAGLGLDGYRLAILHLLSLNP